VIYGGIGILAAEEQAAAVREVIRSRPYMDSARVGLWGWSGGGSMTLHGMFRYPTLYKVGISVAPITDQRYYDTIYQERYMSTPQLNPDGYRRGSPITYAAGLKGKLFLVAGTGDDNCHFQVDELLVNKLIELGKQFDFMAYPNRTHSISEGSGTTVHLYSTLARYLVTHLPREAR
jgi:dipeptidyl-peptidase-4